MHVLWLKTELLHPVDKGGRIRTYQTLRVLREHHRVTYLCLDDGTAAPNARELAQEYAHDVVTVPFTPPAKGSAGFFAELGRNAFSSLPYAVARYRSSRMRDAIAEVVARRSVDLVICDFLAPSVNVPGNLPVPAVLFQHNVEAAIWERHASVAANAVKRAYMAEQWRRMRRFERDECHRYDHVIAVSDADAETMRRDYGVTRVASVPTGVDIDFFRPSAGARRDGAEIVFTGSMDWMPNEDGVAWFVDEVLPLVRARVPGATLSIVGRNPTTRVQALAGRAPGVTVTGSVPDVRPYLERAAAFVVPLRVGGGTRLKIYEAMAMECAVVSTTVGAEGLPVTEGEEIVRADDASSFAAAVVAMLEEPAQARRIGEAAARRVRREFGWERAGEAFVRQCEDAVAGRRPAPLSARAS